ncbi:MAG: methylated-DNA--[protein]-cysteine S-methyltransferase [Clostridia bacterium]|nr:methylated-DNA--[protein]-cysteine S-methyltransferase [Clostridia bacterium]
MYTSYYKNEKITIKIKSTKYSITEITFVKGKDDIEDETTENSLIRQCKKQLDDYFKGKLKKFNIKYEYSGTPFQEKVWKELLNIEYGTTISYKELAQRIGSPKSVRAVANAVGKNKIGVIIPCHRIIGTNGTLTGYAGGIENKRYLLEIENSIGFKLL